MACLADICRFFGSCIPNPTAIGQRCWPSLRFRISNNNDRIQPVWYRVVHVENGQFKWARYIDSYHPFPPRTDYDPKVFYRDLVNLNKVGSKISNRA